MQSQSYNVVLVGATGYTGIELLRLLSHHPFMRVIAATSEQHAGHTLASFWPHLHATVHFDDLTLRALDDVIADQDLLARANIVFLALPHATSAQVVVRIIDAAPEMRIIDLSADFRFDDQHVYERWYTDHCAPHLLKDFTYALVEHNTSAIAQSRLLAVPGCYPTAVLLALIPLVTQGIITFAADDPIIAHCTTGVSGAGRSLKISSLFGEVKANAVQPYGLAGHRHIPEIAQELKRAHDRFGESVGSGHLHDNHSTDHSKDSRDHVPFVFVPHVVAVSRGMMASCYVRCRGSLGAFDVHHTLQIAYADTPFVSLLPLGVAPSMGHVVGTNRCIIGVVDVGYGCVMVVCVIDNIGKGASGQAIQACNVMLGLDQTLGLESLPLWP